MQVDGGDTSQRAVMHDIRIGDRQRSRACAGAVRASSASWQKTMFGRPKASVLAFMP
jgi:hypothetical protein